MSVLPEVSGSLRKTGRTFLSGREFMFFNRLRGLVPSLLHGEVQSTQNAVKPLPDEASDPANSSKTGIGRNLKLLDRPSKGDGQARGLFRFHSQCFQRWFGRKRDA